MRAHPAPTPTPIGLELPAVVTFEQWARVGRKLGLLHNSSSFCLGDWLRAGERRFAKSHGSRYRDAIALTGLDYHSLANKSWVCGRIPIERRRPKLSFDHHQTVAALSPAAQDMWLERAERERMSTRELRRRVGESRRALHNAGPLRHDHEPEHDSPATSSEAVNAAVVVVSVSVPAEAHARWLAAAAAQGSTLVDWLVDVAERAAAYEANGRRPLELTAST